MDLTGPIVSFATGSYVVTRTTLRTYSGGLPTAAVTSTFTITDACVQPLTGRELKDLPEGLRGKEVRAVYSPTELKTVTDATEPDSISIDGAAWRVELCEPWGLGSYWRAVVQKKGTQG
jgi:hypothetical protein